LEKKYDDHDYKSYMQQQKYEADERKMAKVSKLKMNKNVTDIED